jgi:hypothetical protein
MSETQSSRRNFLKILGLSAGATLAGKSALAAFVNKEEILKLTPAQQEFMIRYGIWMDEFAETNRQVKADPASAEHRKRMMLLSEKAEKFQPELAMYMKDGTFAMVYKESIQRVTSGIRE